MSSIKKWGIGVLAAAVCVVAWYVWLVPKVSVDRSTPRTQNGLRLKAVYLRANGAERYLEAFVETLPEARLPEGQSAPPVEFKVAEYPTGHIFVYPLPGRSSHPGTQRVGIWLNHPPTVRHLTLEARQGDRVARWRLIPPRSIHAVKPQDSYDEWIRHPEVEARLSVDAEVYSQGGATLVAGFRELTVRTQEPYRWVFGTHNVIPEWLTPVWGAESPQQLTAKPKPSELGGLFSFRSTETPQPPRDEAEPPVGGLGFWYLPFANTYRVCRVIGTLQKYETYEETVDLTGIPVRVHRDKWGNRYMLPVRSMEWTTPSGLRVRWEPYLREPKPRAEKGFLVGELRIENRDGAAQASPLARKYNRPSDLRLVQEEGKDYHTSVLSGIDPSYAWMWVYVRPHRVGKDGRLPPLRLRFKYFAFTGESIEFDRVLPVRVRHLTVNAAQPAR